MNKGSFLALAATATVAACGAPQQPLGPSPLLSQTRSQAVVRHLARFGRSWIRPGTSGEDLVYAADQNVLYQNIVYIFAVPSGKLVGQIMPDGEEVTEGMCSDANGDVWVLGWTTNGQAFYDEYGHGGVHPNATIIAEGIPNGCAVDASTGDLAVANFVDYNVNGRQGDLAIYTSASGKPVDYYGNTIEHYYYCAYDDKGNLLADGDNVALNELPKGGSTVRNVYLNRKITPGSMQWDGKYVSVVALGSAKGPTVVDRITFNGSSAQIVGSTKLTTAGDYGTYLTVQFAIGDGKIMGPAGGSGGPARNFDLWPYPGGGNGTKAAAQGGNPDFYGTALSIAPKGKR